MIVMKFGGTSVESAPAIQQVISIITQKLERRPIVVASAMAKITDTLLNSAYLARDGKETEARELIEQCIMTRHRTALRELVHDQIRFKRVGEDLETLFGEVLSLVHGVAVVKEATLRALDAIASYGERLSTVLLTAALQERGIDAVLVDARSLIITDDNYTRAHPQMDECEICIRRVIEPIVARNMVPVTQGFVGATLCGITTTLGRGGSDYSGAIIGALCGADAIEIWTDVDGVMTSDPRVVPTARVLPRLTFAEASELAYFGAKVLHPSTISPAIERNVPVFVFNTKQPEARGTKITAQVPAEEGDGARAIAFKKGITVITLTSTGVVREIGFLPAILKIFEQHRTEVDVVATGDVRVSLSIDDAHALDEIVAEISNFAEVEIERDRAIVSLVGERMKYIPGIAAKVFNVIRDTSINVISQRASEINLSFIVAEDQAVPVVTRLHKEMFGV